MSAGNFVNQAEIALREWLKSTAPKRGARLPSERALAAQFGLQHYATNRAMGRLIMEGLVERDGYKLIAAEPKSTRAPFCCHLVVAQRSVYIPSYRRIAKEMGIKLIIHTWESSEEAMRALEALDDAKTEAVVLDPPSASPISVWAPISRRLHQRGIPFACIGQVASGLASVLADTGQSMQLALLHLMELGHSQIGLITPPPTTPVAAEVIRSWSGLCRMHGLAEAASNVHLQSNLRLREEAEDAVAVLTNSWHKITAVVVVTMPDCNIQLLQDQLAQKGRRVPENLSLVFIGDAKKASAAMPPISSVSSDTTLTQETAFFLVQRAARKKTSMGILPPSFNLAVQAQLTVRQSTRALNASGPAVGPALLTSTETANVSESLTKSPVVNAPSLEVALRKPYPLASRAFLSERTRFAPLNLEPFVNRPLNFRRGWLGDLPLKQLTPGTHEIHGVPFTILGGPKRSDCGSIVFHSVVNTTGNAHKLPDKLKIPIGGKAQAVYILHGCGYAKFLHTFAHYEFRNRTTSLDRIPLVSLGQPPVDYDLSQQPANAPVANMQDWWPDFPHMDFPNSRMAPIPSSDESHSGSRHVFLYTLEWINPHPETTVSHLEITVDSTHSTTLGVLAITVLRP